MGSVEGGKKSLRVERNKKATYAVPKIIYEGKISIRAGTPESAIPGVPSSDSLPFEDTRN
jgi:hypothetical protein